MGDSIFAIQTFQIQSGQIQNTIHVTCSFFFSCLFLCVFFLLFGSLFFHPLPFSSPGLLEMTELVPTRAKYSCMIKKKIITLLFLTSRLAHVFHQSLGLWSLVFPERSPTLIVKLGTWEYINSFLPLGDHFV